MINYIMMRERTVILCCGRKAGCPVMTITDDDRVKIKDDHGNTVIMELSQAKLIGESLEKVVKSEK